MDKVTELIQLFNDVTLLSSSFSNRTRGKPLVPNTRFKSINAPSSGLNGYWSYSDDKSDAIDFKLNKPLYLAGVRLFGNKNCTYDVTLTLYRSDCKLKHMSSQINSGDEKIYNGYYGFNVYLDGPVPIKADVVYTIEATISGPLSYYGDDLDTASARLEKTVIMNIIDDIEITYMSSKKSKNGTSALRGQFPTLLFKRPVQKLPYLDQ